MELGSVTLKTNNQHTLVCVCGSPKRTNSIPAASVVCPTIPPGRANPFFLSCHNKCPLQRGLCACFVVSRITRSPPICAWPGACRAGRARDRGLNCPSWCVEGFRIGVSQGDLSGRGRAVGLQSRPLDLRSRTLCANPVCGSFVSPRPWKTGWEAEERRATLRAGGRKTGTARSMLYLMTGTARSMLYLMTGTARSMLYLMPPLVVSSLPPLVGQPWRSRPIINDGPRHRDPVRTGPSVLGCPTRLRVRPSGAKSSPLTSPSLSYF